jgi:hypothetical protein
MAPQSKKASDVIPTLKLKPSEVTAAINSMMRTTKKRALFVWGSPGISKSAVFQSAASAAGIAAIDVRLSQMDPTDLRGIPYPSNQEGVEGVLWSAPLVLPRDIDLEATREVRAVETTFKFYNPMGVNDIPYCRKPTVAVRSLTPGLEAFVVTEPGAVVGHDVDGNELYGPADRFVAVLKDAKGQPQAGEIAYTVKGKVRALLGLEEFNSAPPSVQAASYQLVLDRRLGDYVVPDGVYLHGDGQPRHRQGHHLQDADADHEPLRPHRDARRRRRLARLGSRHQRARARRRLHLGRSTRN